MTTAIKVKNDQYINFKEIKIIKSILQPAISFSFSSSKQKNIKIFTGDKVSINDNNNLMVEGYINQINKNTDTNIDKVSYAGRSLIADIIDCTVAADPANWVDATPKLIINDLLKPFGIKSDFTENITDKIKFSTKLGDKVFSVIENLLSRYNLISFEETPGILKISKAASSGSIGTLKFGNTKDILKLTEYNENSTNRFSEYNVIGDSGVIIQEETGGKAEDDTIKRFRPLTIQLDGDVTNEQCQKRAEYERTIAAANSLSFSYLVPSWLGPNNKNWQPNSLVTILDSEHNLDNDYLLVTVEFIETINTKTAILKFAPPKSFTSLPQPEPTKEFFFF